MKQLEIDLLKNLDVRYPVKKHYEPHIDLDPRSIPILSSTTDS